MEGGPPMFKQDFSCPALLMSHAVKSLYRAITFFGYPFQNIRIFSCTSTGLVRVRSPLLTESRLISFPPATEMFQFTGFASMYLYIQYRIPLLWWVSPFGHRRVKGCSHLTVAFRSVPRPSSPLSAKASTKCSYSLERFYSHAIHPFKYPIAKRRDSGSIM